MGIKTKVEIFDGNLIMLGKCPKCESRHIHQISMETIEYCLKDNRVHKIKWDSETQVYRCMDCEYEVTKL